MIKKFKERMLEHQGLSKPILIVKWPLSESYEEFNTVQHGLNMEFGDDYRVLIISCNVEVPEFQLLECDVEQVTFDELQERINKINL